MDFFKLIFVHFEKQIQIHLPLKILFLLNVMLYSKIKPRFKTITQ